MAEKIKFPRTSSFHFSFKHASHVIVFQATTNKEAGSNKHKTTEATGEPKRLSDIFGSASRTNCWKKTNSSFGAKTQRRLRVDIAQKFDLMESLHGRRGHSLHGPLWKLVRMIEEETPVKMKLQVLSSTLISKCHCRKYKKNLLGRKNGRKKWEKKLLPKINTRQLYCTQYKYPQCSWSIFSVVQHYLIF